MKNEARPAVDSAHLGLGIFMVAETMLFAGIVSAYLIFRIGAADWPPPGMPLLPLGVTIANTLILLSSGVTVRLALRAMRTGKAGRCVRLLAATVLLGLLFLLVQGFEWTRLLRQGLTLSSGVYGGSFYVLVGLHAAHVVGAAIWLNMVLARAATGKYAPGACRGLSLCAFYWIFVVALWPLLFALVYLPWKR